ncbi:MAG: sarcosine oxidase subunit delta [Mesorhizobium sp.]
MQLLPCPFCGLRDETEFHYRGETGIVRPEGSAVSDNAWADYLYMRTNARGETCEIWVHLTCGEFFAMRRNTVSHEVLESRFLYNAGGRE